MAKLNLYVSNFTAGEISPKMYGRVDNKKYQSGCKTLENMMVQVYGGVTRRPGTYYLTETKSSGKVRLVPFRVSPTNAFVLEMGEKYVRFYKNCETVTSGTSPYEIASPYTLAQMMNVKVERVDGSLYFVHKDLRPYILTRTSDTNWSFTPVSFTAMPSTWTTGAFPNAAAYYEQRMFYASDDKIYASMSQTPDDMTTGTNDDDGFVHNTAAEEIRWMSSGSRLAIGDFGAIWTFYSGSEDLAITPARGKIRNETNDGSSGIQGLKVGSVTLFIQRAQRKVRQFAYKYTENAYTSEDISIIAEHITDPYISDWDYQSEPDSTVWAIRGDGVLLGITYDKEQEVIAWHRHITGTDTTGTHDEYESVAIIPYDGTAETNAWDVARDVAYVSVKRNIGGTEKRYIEYFMPEFNGDDADLVNAFYVDCGLTYSGSATTVVGGLDHLIGREVSILANGAVQPNVIVPSGATIAISPAATPVHVGLPYASVLEPLILEREMRDGTAQGRRRRIHDIMIRFYKTLGGNVGSNKNNITIVPFRKPSDPMDSAPSLFDGDKILPFEGGWETNGDIRITQEQPLPMTVLSFSPRITIND